MRRILRFGREPALPAQRTCGYPISARFDQYLEERGQVRVIDNRTGFSHETAKYLPLGLNAIIPIRTLAPGTAAA